VPRRPPLLAVVSVLYLGFLGAVTLTPGQGHPDYYDLAERILARMQQYPDLDPLTYRLSPERIEFLANVGLFVPLGVFFLLLAGRRLWWSALVAGVLLTATIETVQGLIPDRVSDPRDVAANSVGVLVGIALAAVLSSTDTVDRARERERA
jgi:VanZ family protein